MDYNDAGEVKSAGPKGKTADNKMGLDILFLNKGKKYQPFL